MLVLDILGRFYGVLFNLLDLLHLLDFLLRPMNLGRWLFHWRLLEQVLEEAPDPAHPIHDILTFLIVPLDLVKVVFRPMHHLPLFIELNSHQISILNNLVC